MHERTSLQHPPIVSKMLAVQLNLVFVIVLFTFPGAFAIRNVSAEINDPIIVYDTFLSVRHSHYSPEMLG